MGRYYLDELGINDEIHEGDLRQSKWDAQQDRLGFDSRDCWSLDYTMMKLLYERLCLYREEANKMIDLEFHKFEFRGKEYTQLALLDRMIEIGEETLPEYWGAKEDPVPIREFWDIWAEIHPAMWW